jgi:hypothetical protein
MAISFPTSLDILTNPSATSDTATVSHAEQHTNANDAIEALEAKVGVNSSAVTSSLDYKLTNASSSNPGHKHTLANGATDVTATAAELNTLDGITSSTAELNVLDGIPGTLTATELGYVDGVTSAIQTQLDGKAATSHTHAAADITSGTIATARLGSGTANSGTYLRGDQTWAAVTSFSSSIVSGSTSNPNTASTSYADLAEMSLTFTSTSGTALVWVNSTMYNSGANATFLALSMDSASEVAEVYMDNTDATTLSTFMLFTGLSAGSHTVKGRWKVSGGTGTASGTRRNIMVLYN